MRQSILRWTLYLLALLAFGPLAGTLTGGLRASDGGPDATLLVCSTPAAGVLAGIGAFAIAAAVGLAGAWLLGALPGLSAAGLVLAWVAWRGGEVTELIRTAQSAAPLWGMALEGLLFGAVALVVVVAIRVIATPGAGDTIHRFTGARPLAVLAVGLVAAAVGAWLVAVTPLKGQAIAAGVVASILAAAAARLVDPAAPIPVLAAPVLVLAAIAPLSGLVLLRGAPDVVHAAYAGTLFPAAHLTPLDWIAGAFLGIPIGISWAASMSSGRVGP